MFTGVVAINASNPHCRIQFTVRDLLKSIFGTSIQRCCSLGREPGMACAIGIAHCVTRQRLGCLLRNHSERARSAVQGRVPYVGGPELTTFMLAIFIPFSQISEGCEREDRKPGGPRRRL